MNRTSTASPQGAPVIRSPSINGGPQAPTPPPWHPEIRSIVQLTIAHAHKIYFSGPLVRRFERQPDGQKPHKDDGWTEVWAQLRGTTLSVWDMKEIQEASKQGREVPPSYINVTDAFIQVLGSVTVPATPTTPSKRYTNVITLNSAGSNLLLFSCPSTDSLISWAAALRLAAWEKSRLEEIYTAHLIRITLNARDVPTTLVRGKMEGWAQIRIAGQTDWKRVWLVVQGGLGIEGDGAGPAGAAVHATMKRNRMSNLFSRETNASILLPANPLISVFMSSKPKDHKKPLLTVHGVTQAFGVYPERPELINQSTLLKVEGTFGDDEMAATFRTREGWVLIMPELENNVGQAAEMLKWVVGLHDAFELYGRPEAWTWDPQDPVSMMFGYPVGPQKDNLFLEREMPECIDPRDDRTSVIRSAMKNLLQTHLKRAVQVVQPRSGTQVDAGLPVISNVVAPRSYIMKVKLPAEPEDWLQRPAYISTNRAGIAICQKRLQYLVRKGDLVVKGAKIPTKFSKFSKNAEDSIFTAVLYTSEHSEILRYTDEGNLTEICKWTVDLAHLPRFIQNANTAGVSKPFYTEFEVGLELDSAEVRGVLLSNGSEFARVVFDFLT